MSNEQIYFGTELKYLLTITAPGFSMIEDDFELVLKRGSRTLTFTKTDFVIDDDDNFYFCFDTRDLGSGLVRAEVTAHIPDPDFEDGIRDEVQKFDVCVIKL